MHELILNKVNVYECSKALLKDGRVSYKREVGKIHAMKDYSLYQCDYIRVFAALIFTICRCASDPSQSKSSFVTATLSLHADVILKWAVQLDILFFCLHAFQS